MRILSADYILPVSQDPIRDGAVVFDQVGIIETGKRDVIVEKYPEADHRRFGEAVIMPGLVNCHSHLELSVLRGFLDGLDNDFSSWLLTLTKTRAEQLTNDDIKVSARFGALEAIKAGVTCFGDIGRNGEAGQEALNQSGLRGVVFQETDFSPDNKTVEDDFKRLSEKVEALKTRESELVKVGISPHAPYTVSPKLFEKLALHSIGHNILLTIHASESEDEQILMNTGEGFFDELYRKHEIDWQTPKTSSIQYLSDLGVLAAKPLLAHCLNVSDRDLELIKASDSRIVHCPKSNAKFGHGIASFGKFLEMGIKVGIGSDSVASNNTCDMFEETRFAALLARTKDENGGFVSAKRMIESATLGGATALGLENEIGTLDIGKQADIIVVSMENVAQYPVYDIYSSLLFATNARDVIFTMVGGRELYSDGELKSLDGTEIKARVCEIAEKLDG